MNTRINKHSQKNVMVLILWFSLLLVSRDSFWFGTSGIKIFDILRDAYVVLLPICLLYFGKMKLRPKYLSQTVFLWIVIILISLYHKNAIGLPISYIFITLTALCISTNYPIEITISCFQKIILYLTIYCLSVWLLLSIGLLSPQIISNIANESVYTLGGNMFFHLGETPIFRNSSIFREPGVFMIYLNIAIISELFFTKKIQKKRIIIFYLGLISTFSTGGLVTGALIFIVFGLLKTKNKSSFIVLTAIMILLIIINAENELFTSTFDKFNTIEESGSGFARLSAFIIPLQMVLSHPIFGVGYDAFKQIYENLGWQIYHKSIDPTGLSTNTVLNIGAIWGVWAAIMYSLGLYNFSKLMAYGRSLVAILLFVIIILMLCNEAMIFNIPLFIFIYYGSYNTVSKTKQLHNNNLNIN